MADFPQKYLKNVSSDLKDNALSMKDEELKKKIIDFEHGISGVELAMSTDTELCALKEQIKAALDPYKEDLNSYKSNIRYCVWVLEERSGGVDTTSKP